MYLSAYADHIYPLLMVATRISAVFILAPVYGSTLIPRQVKLAILVMLTGVMHFGFSVGMDYSQTDNAVILLDIVREFLVGAGMGLVVQTIFTAIGFAGAIIAPQMGLAISQLIDPQTESMQPVLSTFLNLVGVLFFLAVNGHLMIIEALFQSYKLLPIGRFELTGPFVDALMATGSEMFIIAFKLSAPVLAVIIFLNVGMALMARIVPQVHVIVVGFIVTIAVGMLIMALVTPAMAPYLKEVVVDAVGRMLWLLKTV